MDAGHGPFRVGEGHVHAGVYTHVRALRRLLHVLHTCSLLNVLLPFGLDLVPSLPPVPLN